MKTLGLGFVLLSILIPGAAAQDSKTEQGYSSPSVNPYQEQIEKLLERYPGSKVIKVYRLRPSWIGGLEPSCGAMRTYSVKREGNNSDVTRPSGYTTCVPMARFRVEDAITTIPEPGEAEPSLPE